MMRLLFFSNSFVGGGSEKSLLTIADSLSQRGYQVIIAANLNNPVYDLPASIKYVEKNSYKIKRSHSYLLIHRKILNYYHQYLDTKRIISEVKPDVIISFLHSNIQAIIWAHGDIPIISSERNTFDRKLGRSEFRAKFKLNKKYDKVTVLTNYDKEYIGNRLDNVVVIPNALSGPVLKLEDYKSSFSSRKNILACGRLSAIGEDGKLVKGFDLLLDAFSLIAEKYPEYDLDIAGDGTAEGVRFLKELAIKRGIGDRVHFLGFIKDIDGLMKSHALFVLSSRAEGFGRVVIESMAVGTPVVAFKCSGPTEIIKDGVDGFLVERENVNKLAEKIAFILNDPEKRYLFGEKALINVKRFSMDIIIKKWEDLFKQVLNDRKNKR